jgi:hypothetical protein
MGFMSNPAGGDGNFTVYVKYNAKAGRWYTKEDKQDGVEFEVTNMTAVFDIANIRTGWFLFAAGVAPAKTFDPSLAEAAAKPGDGFKRGFELLAFSDKNLGGKREFSSTAGAVIESMNALYDAYVAAPESKAGKLPIVKCVGVHPITGKHGTNYQPQLEIVGWADRPAELGGATSPQSPAPQAAAAPAPSPAPAKHAPPPQLAPAGDVDDVEF